MRALPLTLLVAALLAGCGSNPAPRTAGAAPDPAKAAQNIQNICSNAAHGTADRLQADVRALVSGYKADPSAANRRRMITARHALQSPTGTSSSCGDVGYTAPITAALGTGGASPSHALSTEETDYANRVATLVRSVQGAVARAHQVSDANEALDLSRKAKASGRAFRTLSVPPRFFHQADRMAATLTDLGRAFKELAQGLATSDKPTSDSALIWADSLSKKLGALVPRT